MTRIPFLITTAAVTLTAAVSPASAQETLGTKPISRAEVIAGVKTLFAKMDSNHDGSVSPQEFEAFRARQGGGTAETNPFGHVGSHWFEKADSNGDGKVTLQEAEAHPLQLFDMADANHDGVVGIDEQKVAMMMMQLRGK